MKKIIFPFAGIGMLLFMLVLSCNKKDSASNNKSNVQNLVVGKPLQLNNSSNLLAPGGLGELPGGGSCNCNGHGGSTGGVLQWTLATCRTNCQRGIGFRCGRQGILYCQDGTTIFCIWGSSCPDAGRGVNPERDMEASYELYENGTMKLTFLKPIPNEEKNSETGYIFEVEQEDFVKFSGDVAVDGISYQGFNILKGNYQINYADGQNGSVVIGIQLKQ
jgi:hypothetical protein